MLDSGLEMGHVPCIQRLSRSRRAPAAGLAVLPFVLVWTVLIAVVLVRERDA